MKTLRISAVIYLLSAVSLICPGSLPAQGVNIDKWLVVSAPSRSLPAFADTKNIRGEYYSIKDLFGFSAIDLTGYSPAENDMFLPGSDFQDKWGFSEVNDAGFTEIKKNHSSKNETALLASYITANRWMKVSLELFSRQNIEVYLDGKLLGSKNTRQAQGEEPGKWEQEIELTTGKHRLLLVTGHSETEPGPWQISGRLILPGWADDSGIKIETSPETGKTINHLLDGTKAGAASLSPDATLYAVNFSRSLPPSDKREEWFEIKRVSDGKIVHSFRHASVRDLSWAPHGNIFSYRTVNDGKSTLWIHDTGSGEYYPVMKDIDDFGSYSWSPDGSFIIYSVSESINDDKGDLKRVLGMSDRLPGYRTRQFLYLVDVRSGWRERLTHGFLSTTLHDICPAGKKILFSQSRPDYSERPYSKQDVFLMDIGSKQVDTIFRDLGWGVSGIFSPDGTNLLLTGGPSSFGQTGENIPGEMTANNYDAQAYLYDLATGNIDPFTRDFAPSLSQVAWSRHDNLVWLLAEDEDFTTLFTYNTRNRRFTRIETGEDVLNWISIARNSPFALYSGSGISSPPKISLLDLKTRKYKTLEDPDRENFRNVVFGNTMEWDFYNTDGTRIPGRVYLPPDFDESEKYPLIVYYYGGTTTVSRRFGGRYPFNMYAANGYVVYVLQPSGAIGFGQEFSARHVNNWGMTVADEIITGTRLFLDDHSFIDPGRVGCMGASYGGFMTMLLQTRTDMFAAAISHAGISSISSYWGEGYWGYGYSAEASAGSFPWNNRQLYVDQSPLFNADKITTPLLLLHGSDDTNVPPGESIQLYTALKLLGRPVELIKIGGEDHHILTYGKRIKWSNTKLAFFDKWLKGQPQWWEDTYPGMNY
jgi:dipeptidyl aminopeptidase/acylaminoacyl peptidase